MDIPVLLQSFLAVFLAEFGDKTQLALVLLSCFHPRPVLVFVAASLAFCFSCLIGALAGDVLAAYIPIHYIHLASGLLFVLFALQGMYYARNLQLDDECDAPVFSFTTIVSAVFMAEMGDKSQLVTFGLAASNGFYNVFAGTSLALILNAGLAVSLGTYLQKLSHKTKVVINYLSSLFFLGIGLIQIFKFYQGVAQG